MNQHRHLTQLGRASRWALLWGAAQSAAAQSIATAPAPSAFVMAPVHGIIIDAIRASPTLFALVQSIHILGFSVLVGAVTILDLRLLGCVRRIAVRDLNALVMPWILLALVAIVPTGLGLFAVHADVLIGSEVFLLKMLLLFTALMNALIFYSGPYQGVSGWNVNTMPPASARLCALLSLALWVGIILCGRLMRVS